MSDPAKTRPDSSASTAASPGPAVHEHTVARQSASPNTSNRDQATAATPPSGSSAPSLASHPSNRDVALTTSLLRRADAWKAATARAQRLSRERAVDLADATQMAHDYRLLAHDLARARRLIPNTRTREFLEAAYVRAHATLYRKAWHPGRALLTLFRDELPEVVRWLTPHIAWATAIFVLTVLTGYWMVHTFPDLIALFASPDLIATVERGQLWTEGILNVVPSSVLALQILTNNIVVSLFAYCAGFVFGLGTLYILGLNGLMLGAVFAFTGQHGLEPALFRFIVAHGCVELSVMCLSGAAGAAVGEALIRPSHGDRMESFRIAALRSGKLLVACAILLVGTGLIEGYISTRTDVPLWARVTIGISYWLFMIALLKGWLFHPWRQRHPPARIPNRSSGRTTTHTHP
jgi:uncharacterized membrane protein SpoIIM required for sporulation